MNKQAITKARTSKELMAALQRMRNNQTRILRPGYKWTKENWAKEAGLNRTTPLQKKKGEFVYKGENEAFKRPNKMTREKKLIAEVARLTVENRKLKEVIAKMSTK